MSAHKHIRKHPIAYFIGVVFFIVVLTAGLYSIYKYRKNKREGFDQNMDPYGYDYGNDWSSNPRQFKYDHPLKTQPLDDVGEGHLPIATWSGYYGKYV
jgi:hypothetical protein